jgi:hypothetical protein
VVTVVVVVVVAAGTQVLATAHSMAQARTSAMVRVMLRATD